MGFFERLPESVRRAIRDENAPALSAMGKKGAETAANNRAFKESENDARAKEAALEQAQSYSVSDEGDVLPPDQAAIDALNSTLEKH
jgi:hypothetical protein